MICSSNHISTCNSTMYSITVIINSIIKHIIQSQMKKLLEKVAIYTIMGLIKMLNNLQIRISNCICQFPIKESRHIHHCQANCLLGCISDHQVIHPNPFQISNSIPLNIYSNLVHIHILILTLSMITPYNHH